MMRTWRNEQTAKKERGEGVKEKADFCSKCGVMAELIALSRG